MSHEDPEAACRALTDVMRRYDDGDLRATVFYDADERAPVYIRDDVLAAYDDEEIDDAIGDLVLEATGDPDRFEHLYKLGDLNGTARLFERGILLNFPLTHSSGVALTYDRAAMPDLETLMATAEGFLAGRLDRDG